MAEQSGGTNSGDNLRVWTFEVISGPPFRIDLPRNPSLTFDGTRVVWKMLGTTALAHQIEGLLIAMGVSMRKFTEEETSEMRAEREALLGKGLFPVL